MARGSVLSRIMGMLFSSICMGLELDVMILKGRSLNSSFQDVRGGSLSCVRGGGYAQPDFENNQFLEDGLDRCWCKMEALSLMFSEQIILIGGREGRTSNSKAPIMLQFRQVYWKFLVFPSIVPHLCLLDTFQWLVASNKPMYLC